jgi:2-methylcitrate dehydratase PrpD
MTGVDETMRRRTGEKVRELLQWAAAARQQPIPASVRRRAALILADDLGAMVAGSDEPTVVGARRVLAASSTNAEATVFAGGALRADRYTVATMNGMAATWCELDEGFRAAPCHAGAYALPALLAEAEASGATVDDVLRTLAIAYEITARFALAFPFKIMTVHPHAAFATVGAAAGASLARNQDARTLLDSVSGATSMAFAGPYRHATDGALVRNAWTSAGAWVGLRSADWAEIGIGGLAETPYDVFVGGFGTDVDPAALTRDLGTAWAVTNGYHKVFACCQYAHAAIEASLALYTRLEGKRSANDIAEIIVETHPRGMTLTTIEPPTTLAAKFSMPHAVAASARLGTGGQRAFAEVTLNEPNIAALRRRVRLAAHPDIRPSPYDRPSRVTWRFEDGEAWTEECASARGGADQPFDDQELMDKLVENAGAVFPRMSGILQIIIDGDETAISRLWRDVVAELVSE